MLLIIAIAFIIVAIAYWIRLPLVNSFLSFGIEANEIISTTCAFIASVLAVINLIIGFRRENKNDNSK